MNKSNIEKLTTGISVAVTVSSAWGLGSMLNPDDYSFMTQTGWVAGGFTYSYVLTVTAIEKYSKAGLWGRVGMIGGLVALPYLMLTPTIYSKYMEIYVSPQYPIAVEELRKIPKFDPKMSRLYQAKSDKEIERYRKNFLPISTKAESYQANREFETNGILNNLIELRKDRTEIKRSSFKTWEKWNKAKKESAYGKILDRMKYKGVQISTINDVATELYMEKTNKLLAGVERVKSDYSVKEVNGRLISTIYQPLINKYSDSANQKVREKKESQVKKIEEKSPLKEWMMYIILFVFGWIFEMFAPRLSSNIERDIETTKKRRDRKELKKIVGEKDFIQLELEKREESVIEKQQIFTMEIVANTEAFLTHTNGEMNSKLNTLYSIIRASISLKPTTLRESKSSGFTRNSIQPYSSFIAKGKKKPYLINAKHQMKYRDFLMDNGALKSDDGVKIPSVAVTLLIQKITSEGF